MAGQLTPIYLGDEIVDRQGGVTLKFVQRWQELIDRFQRSSALAIVRATAQTAAITTTSAWTTRSAGLYRLSWYLRKTVADGVSSSAQVTLGWVESASPQSMAMTALTADAVTSPQSGSIVVEADNASDLTYAVAYASNTPAKMTYRLTVTVEKVE